MPKEQYVDLLQFKEIESIRDLEVFGDYKEGLSELLIKSESTLKPYLTFRSELKRDLEKNKFMLEEVEDEELDRIIEEVKEVRGEFERE